MSVVKSPLVSIVIVAYNRPKLTKQTITSLQKTLEDSPISTEVIVVDNQSDIETQNLIQKFSQIKIVRIENNIGCGAGKNRGVSISKGKLLYISDNDMYFLDGWLESLIEAKKTFTDFKIIGSFRHPFHGVIKKHSKNNLVIEESDQQVGSSWFLSRKTWEQYGPLDETVETGKDDALMCQKITQAGFKLGAVTPNLVIHCGATDTTGEISPGSDRWSVDPEYYSRLPKGAIIK